MLKQMMKTLNKLLPW